MKRIKELLAAWVHACAARIALRLDDPVSLRDVITPARVFIVRSDR